jgi:hypothetical protein
VNREEKGNPNQQMSKEWDTAPREERSVKHTKKENLPRCEEGEDGEQEEEEGEDGRKRCSGLALYIRYHDP